MAELPLQSAVATRRDVRDAEFDVQFADGTLRHIIGNATPLFDTNGQVRGCLGAFLDITERREQQDRISLLNVRLQRAIAEGHHRIKNNLQVLSALIDFQMIADDYVPVSILHRLQQHIRTLAALHDLLTQDARENESPTETVSLKAALKKLVEILREVGSDREIIMARVDDAPLSVKQCGTFTLLVNEIVQNAVKHGEGVIEISVTGTGNQVCVEVSDEGPGFPPDFDPRQAANTGLELIESMARWDLRGETFYENRATGGARVIVLFPMAR